MLLSMVHPSYLPFTVTIHVDRVFSVESIEHNHPTLFPVKVLQAVHVVVYDRKGTKMVIRLDSVEMMNRYLWLLIPGFTFKLIKVVVSSGGYGIHEDYHLRAVEETQIIGLFVFFRPFPYELWTPTNLSTSTFPSDWFFDVVGFLQYVSPICMVNRDGIWDKEIRLILSSGCNKDSRRANDVVICELRGAWLDAVEEIVNVASLFEVPPFVHLRYVVRKHSTSSDVSVVHSYCDATYLDVDPSNKHLQEIKAEMLSM